MSDQKGDCKKKSEGEQKRVNINFHMRVKYIGKVFWCYHISVASELTISSQKEWTIGRFGR